MWTPLIIMLLSLSSTSWMTRSSKSRSLSLTEISLSTAVLSRSVASFSLWNRFRFN